jgi:hypothetical protein
MPSGTLPRYRVYPVAIHFHFVGFTQQFQQHDHAHFTVFFAEHAFQSSELDLALTGSAPSLNRARSARCMTDAITASGTTAGSAPWLTSPETPRVDRAGAVLRTAA